MPSSYLFFDYLRKKTKCFFDSHLGFVAFIAITTPATPASKINSFRSLEFSYELHRLLWSPSNVLLNKLTVFEQLSRSILQSNGEGSEELDYILVNGRILISQPVRYGIFNMCGSNTQLSE